MRLNITLPDDLANGVRVRAHEEGVSVSEYFARLIEADERRRNREAWSAEVLEESPPTEEDLAKVRRFLERARRRASAQQSAE
jgi:post-segregation antitoxin (ccd killing protein)